MYRKTKANTTKLNANCTHKNIKRNFWKIFYNSAEYLRK